MKPSLHNTVAMALGVVAISIVPLFEPESYGKETTSEDPASTTERIAVSQLHSLLPIASPKTPEQVARTIDVVVTAYSSTVWETDDTPFITASGTTVRDGIVAANFLPMGTKVRLPRLYGEKIFVVEDRMHPRKGYQVDIWFPSYMEALNFGAQHTYVEVLEG